MQRLGNLPIGAYFIYDSVTYQKTDGVFTAIYVKVRNMATDAVEYLDSSTQVEEIV